MAPQVLLILIDPKSFGYQKRLDLVFVGMLQGEGKEKVPHLGSKNRYILTLYKKMIYMRMA